MKRQGILYASIFLVILIVGALLIFRPNGGTRITGDETFNLPALTKVAGQLTQTYSDPDLRFSFKYSGDFVADASGDATARLVLLSAASQSQEFQLYVTPFGDSPDSVTPDRIKCDVQGIDMRNATMISVPGGGRGVSFLSTRSGVSGDVREIWFASKGHLFQWSAPVASEVTMEAAISTLNP